MVLLAAAALPADASAQLGIAGRVSTLGIGAVTSPSTALRCT
jgi:hypothetical protein